MNVELLTLIDLCARRYGFEPARATPPPGPDFDWALFCSAAVRHKVSEAVLRGLSRVAPAPPPRARERLKLEAAANSALQSLLVSEWRRIDGALGAAGIRAIVMKGPAFAIQFYGGIGAREYRDIDLLVEAKALGKVSHTFASLGYEPVDPYGGSNPRQRRFCSERLHHLAFKKKGCPAYFEVHGGKGRSIGLAPVSVEAAFEKMEYARADEASFPTLGREDHRLLVLHHGAKHGWCVLRWILDAMVALRDAPMRVEAARGWMGEDTARVLHSFSRLARRMFADDFLEEYSLPAGREWTSAKSSAERAYGIFCAGMPTGRASRGLLLSTARFRWGLRRGLVSKLKSMEWIVTPNAQDFSMLGYAAFPIPFYYLARPVIVAARSIRRSLGRASPEEPR